LNKEELKQSFCGWMPFLLPTSRNHSSSSSSSSIVDAGECLYVRIVQIVLLHTHITYTDLFSNY